MKKFLILSCLLFSFSNSALANENEKIAIGIHGDSIAILKDKSGNYFQIRYQTSIKFGKAYFGYDIQNIKGGKILLLAGGSYDGADGSCGQGLRKEMLNLKKIVTPPVTFTIKDINGDQYLDILAEFVEEDCKTNEKTDITNIFYATENGFVSSDKNHSPKP